MKRIMMVLAMLFLVCGTAYGYTINLRYGELQTDGSFNWESSEFTSRVTNAHLSGTEVTILPEGDEGGRTVDGRLILRAWSEHNAKFGPEIDPRLETPFTYTISLGKYAIFGHDELIISKRINAFEGKWVYLIPYTFELGTPFILAGGFSLSDLNWDKGMTRGPERVEVHMDLGFGVDISLPEERAPIPEPGTFLLLGSGLAGLAGMRFRRKENELL